MASKRSIPGLPQKGFLVSPMSPALQLAEQALVEEWKPVLVV